MIYIVLISKGSHPTYGIENQVTVDEFESKLPLAFRTYKESEVEKYFLGPLNYTCGDCDAKYFKSEIKKENKKQIAKAIGKKVGKKTKPKKNIFKSQVCKKGSIFLCCGNGNIDLANLEDPPELIKNLYNGTHKHSKVFMKNIRILNNAFSFTSLGTRLDQKYANAKKGGYTFRIQGTMYHYIGSINPKDKNEKRKFAQIYFYDSSYDEVKRRIELCKEIPEELINELNDCFHQFNCLLRYYKQVGLDLNNKKEEFVMVIKESNDLDRRVYNAPTGPEQVAVLMPTGSNLIDKRDIVIKRQDDKLKNIDETHVAIDPLSYALLFPRGEQGYHRGLKNKKNKKISQLEYSRYRLQVRDNNFNTILKSGKLCQEFITNEYVKIEAERMRYHYTKKAQQDYRIASYAGLVDAFNKDIDKDDVGTSFILPSSFTGSPRYMQQLYQDSMALVTKFGRPQLFITMTCNPNWKEIQTNLLAKELAWDRPDLVNRVFRKKLDELIDDVKVRNIFGKATALVYTVEFQKRGLPHAHMLLCLDYKDHIRTAEQVDRIVSAEIPNPETEPELYQSVLSYMIHRPCKNDINQPCRKGTKKCMKNFPKDFQEQTIYSENTYPKYKRSANGTRVNIKGQEVGNEYVIPFNKYLLKKYDSHVNVEVCAGIQVVKYLYKYIYKGWDRAMIEISSKDKNEIKSYQDSRFVGATEAHWKIMTFESHLEYPNVYRLPVHCEDKQSVTFNANDANKDIEQILKEKKDTLLTKWFDANKQAEDAFLNGHLNEYYNGKDKDCRIYKYTDFVEHYWYESTKKKMV